MENESNSSRFITCYNRIDSALRTQGEMRRSISYTEAVRRAAKTNSLVRKYEEDLVDYGRLRNAIVHSTNEDYVIAEPHLEVVEAYEKIANLICTPPLAVNTVCNRNFKSLLYNEKLCDVVEYIYKSGISTIPIYKDEMLIGVANATKITRVIGKWTYEKRNLDELFNMPIENVLKIMIEDNYYTIADDRITLDKVLDLFTENRKLLLIVITKSGSLLEKPIGIVTVGDIMDINKILDNYQ